MRSDTWLRLMSCTLIFFYKHLEKIEILRFQVPKGEGAAIKEHAKAQGESLSAFVNRAVKETIERDRKKKH